MLLHGVGASDKCCKLGDTDLLLLPGGHGGGLGSKQCSHYQREGEVNDPTTTIQVTLDQRLGWHLGSS